MCSEEDPTVCHRFQLVARLLVDRGIAPLHIRGNGRLETHADLTDGGRDGQLLLFPDANEELPWRSLRSVLHKQQQQTSSENFDDTEFENSSTVDLISNLPPKHWLQVNNLHFVEGPFWNLSPAPFRPPTVDDRNLT